jgi:hypothetical protein
MEAERRVGQRFEPGWIDLDPALFANSVGPSLETLQCVGDFDQELFRILTQRKILGLLIRLAGIVGHVVAVSQVFCSLGVHLGDYGFESFPLILQERPEHFGSSNYHPTSD